MKTSQCRQHLTNRYQCVLPSSGPPYAISARGPNNPWQDIFQICQITVAGLTAVGQGETALAVCIATLISYFLWLLILGRA